MKYTACLKSFSQGKLTNPKSLRFYKDFDNTPILQTVEKSIKELAEDIVQGFPFMPAIYFPSSVCVCGRDFLTSQIICLDLEGQEHSERRFFSTFTEGLKPAFVYHTYNWTEQENRNRAVWILEKPVQSTEYLTICRRLTALYENGVDSHCIDLARLFYGTNKGLCSEIEERFLSLDSLPELKMNAVAGKPAKNSFQAHPTKENIIVNHLWEKAIQEPLFKMLIESERHYHKQDLLCLLSNLKPLNCGELGAEIFRILENESYRFNSDTIKEAISLWEAEEGFGTLPLYYAQSYSFPNGYKQHDSPLSFILHAKKSRNLADFRASDVVLERLKNYNFKEKPHNFVVNGGCALGKTYTFLSNARLPQFQKQIFLCSRATAKKQNLISYPDCTENINEFKNNLKPILCITYHRFIMAWRANELTSQDFNLIIADEAHSLFMDTIFAEPMGAFIYLAKTVLKDCPIIWMTASDETFRWCVNLFDSELKLDFVFPLESAPAKYTTSRIVVSRNHRCTLDEAIRTAMSANDRIIVECRSAVGAYLAAKEYKQRGYKTGFVVSLSCTRSIKVEQLMSFESTKSEQCDILLTDLMDEWCAPYSMRLDDYIVKYQKLPDWCDVLFTTSTLQESVNIYDVHYIATQAYTQNDIEQIRGRARENVNVLWIIPDARGEAATFAKQFDTFEKVKYENQQQMLLRFKHLNDDNNKTPYVILISGSIVKGNAVFARNEAALIALQRKKHDYDIMMRINSDEMAEHAFGYLAAGPCRTEFVSNQKAEERYVSSNIAELAAKFAGKPLIGKVLEDLFEAAEPFLKQKNGGKDFTLKLILKKFQEAGWKIKRKQITKKMVKDGIVEEACYRSKYYELGLEE